MHILLFNTKWMVYNVSLAAIAVIFAWLTLQTKSMKWKIIFGAIWILFLPNTIYILTDIEHFFKDFLRITPSFEFPLILEYSVLMTLGIITFILAMYPLELILKKAKIKILDNDIFFISMNFIVAFGVVLGRVERTNSWDVVFNIKKVILDSLHIISTTDYLFLFILFGLICNFIYFPFRRLMQKYDKSFLRRLF